VGEVGKRKKRVIFKKFDELGDPREASVKGRWGTLINMRKSGGA